MAGESVRASINVLHRFVTKRFGTVCDVYVVVEMTEMMTQRSNYHESCIRIELSDVNMTFIYEYI